MVEPFPAARVVFWDYLLIHVISTDGTRVHSDYLCRNLPQKARYKNYMNTSCIHTVVWQIKSTFIITATVPNNSIIQIIYVKQWQSESGLTNPILDKLFWTNFTAQVRDVKFKIFQDVTSVEVLIPLDLKSRCTKPKIEVYVSVFTLIKRFSCFKSFQLVCNKFDTVQRIFCVRSN